MKSKTLLLLLSVSAMLRAQDHKTVNPVDLIVAKKTIQFGFQTNLGLGIHTNKEIASSFLFNPKISYFIKDKLSFGVGYSMLNSNFNPQHKPGMLHTGEVEFKYFFVVKKPVLFYTHIGYAFGQLPALKWNGAPGLNPQLASALKFGAGVSWRFKKIPNLAINLELNEYLNLRPGGKLKLPMVPDFSIGFTYFLKPHKKKKVKALPEN